MQKYYIPLLFGLILNLSTAKADNLRDSIGVENLNGKKLIIHQVVAKDTYYAIGRRYNVSPKEVMAYNNNKFLSIGLVVKVPTNIPFSGNAPAAVAKTEIHKPVESAKQQLNTPAKTAVTASQESTEFTEHAVQRKENLMMLARQYGTTVGEIKRINDLTSVNLKIGQVLKMPVKAGAETTAVTSTPVQTAPVQSQYKKPEPAAKPTQQQQQQQQQQETPAAKDQLVVHTVASNETMYSIATKYNLTLDQLKAKNNLTTNSLYVGQKLLINGQYPVKPEHAENNAVTNEADTIESVKNPSLRLPASRYGLSQMDEKGAGIWIADKDLDSSKMLVLHRTAPIGTIMKITNPMSNRSTFAKVVGKFTENESTKDVIIVVTKAVADALGALDKRFLCNLTYSGQANEQ